jgi:hypothetical protein
MYELAEGDVGGAARNIGQMALDFPTGGFLDRSLSLANLLPDAWAPSSDITTAEDRFELSDRLPRRWRPDSAVGRLALDFVGGVALDPLTYVTLGTSALAKSAIAGSGKVAGRAALAKSLRKTKGGREAFEAAIPGAIQKSLSFKGQRAVFPQPQGTTWVDRLGRGRTDGMAQTVDELIARHAEFGLTREAAARLGRHVEGEAAVDVWKKVTGQSEFKVSGGNALDPTVYEDLDRGFKALEGGGFIQDNSVRFMGMRTPLRTSHVVGALAPSLIQKVPIGGGRKLGETLPFAMANAAVEDSMIWLQRNFHRRTAGRVPKALQDHADRAKHARMVLEAKNLERIREVWGEGFEDAEARKLAGDYWSRAHDLYHETLNGGRALINLTDTELLRRAAAETGELGVMERGREAATGFDELERAFAESTAGLGEAGRRLAESRARARDATQLVIDEAHRVQAARADLSWADRMARLRGDAALDLGPYRDKVDAAIREEDGFLKEIQRIGDHRKADLKAYQDDLNFLKATRETFHNAVRKAFDASDAGKAEAEVSDLMAQADGVRVMLVNAADRVAVSRRELVHRGAERKLADQWLEGAKMRLASAEEELARATRMRNPERAKLAVEAGLDEAERNYIQAQRHVKDSQELVKLHDMYKRIAHGQAEAAGEAVTSKAQLEFESALGSYVARKAVDAIAADTGIDVSVVERAMKSYSDDMGAMPKKLRQYGVWKFVDPKRNPFYIPQQAGNDIAHMLSAGASDENFQIAIKSVFDRRRKYRTHYEFVEALEETAKKHGIKADPADLAETDIAALHLRRMDAFARTMERAFVANKARRVFGMKPNDATHQWLKGVYEPVIPRQDVLTKFIGGGVFRPFIKEGKLGDAMRDAAARNKNWKIKNGRLEIPWRGVNYLYKPLLTVVNPNFHFRNNLGAIQMGFFDEDIGAPAIRTLIATMEQIPAVLGLKKAGWAKGDVANFIRAMDGDAESAKRLAGKTYGSYTAEHVLDLIKPFTLDRTSRADLLEQIGRVDLMPKQGAKGYEWLVRQGHQVSHQMERAHRIGGFLELLQKGVPAPEAFERVERSFVNYDVSSNVERVVRDILPFAKFAMASTAWLQEIAKRPRLAWPARLNAAAGGGAPGHLPEHIREGIGIPIGEDEQGQQQYLTSLGLPQEAAFESLSVLPTPSKEGMTTGFRRNVLGAMQPLLRLPAEATVNRSFYFGSEWAKYRRAPNMLAKLGGDVPGVEEIELPDGRKLYEVPALFNEALSAQPLSKVVKTIDSWFDDRKTPLEKVLTSTTGLRIHSVDEERELKKALASYLQDKVSEGSVAEVRRYFSRLDPDETPEDLKLVLDTYAEKMKSKRRKKPRVGGTRLSKPVGQGFRPVVLD